MGLMTRRDIGATLLAAAVVALVPLPVAAQRRAPATRQTSTASTRSHLRAARLIARSELRGGHFNRLHVAKPLSFLRARAVNVRGAFKTAVSGRRPPSQNALRRAARGNGGVQKKKKRREFSTFASEPVAQAALARALTRNDAQIRAWLRSGAQNTFTLQTRVPGSSGTVYLRNSRRVVTPKKAVFVLRRDGRAFRLHTGYVTSKGAIA